MAPRPAAVAEGLAARVRAAREEALHALPELLREAEPLRARYLDLVREQGLEHAENLTDVHAWTVYVHYTDWVRRLAPGPGARIVDWGGLHGQVTALLRARGFRGAVNYLLHPPRGYEAVRRALDLPTAYGKEPNRLDLEDASADVVLSSGVLEHVREDGVGREDLILRDIARVLRPGGLFVAWNLPTKLAAGDLVGKLRGRWYHETRYWPWEVRALVEGAGLDLVHLERHGGPIAHALKALAGARPEAVFAWEHRLHRVPLLGELGQNFALAARKP